MAIIVDQKRDQAVRNQIQESFLGHRRDPGAAPEPEEVLIDNRWELCFDLPHTPLTGKAEELFRRFMRHCMDTSFAAESGKRIVFSLGDQSGGEEDALLEAGAEGIEIRASHERGVFYAAMRILKMFADRKAPCLRRGTLEIRPRFAPRITSTVFYTSDLKLADIDEAFPEEYLALMAFHGINGIFWEIDFYDYSGSEVLPELKCPDYAANVARLNEVIARLAAYGIRLHFLYSVRVLPEDHPVFLAHPDARGARVKIGKEEDGFCLCSSSENVLRYYEDGFAMLHRDAPGLEGPILLVGGERFTHCFTRPSPPLVNKTNCKVCGQHRAAEVVARMVNRVAAAVHRVSPHARVFCWPYSAFTWSGPEDNYQLELVRNLADDVCLLSNFSTGEIWPGSGALLGDYNIMMPGPSARFRAQQAELAAKGRRDIHTKAECSTTPFMFQFPYLPLPYRWAERAGALKQREVAGVFYHYRYYGFTGGLADELAMESVWRELNIDDFLTRYCQREYGQFAPEMLEGWRKMSETWGLIPYSMALSGERQYYVKGPLYLGPAHPMIFDVQNTYGLTRGFTRIRGSVLYPRVSDEERERLSSKAYASDLMFTWPMGAAACEEALRKVVEAWEDAVNTFTGAFKDPNPAALDDLGICRMVGIHFRSAYNVTRFYRKRDQFLSEGGPDADFIDRAASELRSLVNAEIDNSRQALALVKRDPRLGYGYSYGIVYDAEMIEEKIRQCEQVLNVELPKLASGLQFHMFGVYR